MACDRLIFKITDRQTILFELKGQESLTGCRRIKGRLRAHRFVAGILARLRAAIAAEVPWGYEDETGFHYGVEPEARTARADEFSRELPVEPGGDGALADAAAWGSLR